MIVGSFYLFLSFRHTHTRLNNVLVSSRPITNTWMSDYLSHITDRVIVERVINKQPLTLTPAP